MYNKMFDSENKGNRRCPRCAKLLSLHLRDEFYIPNIYKHVNAYKEDTYTITTKEMIQWFKVLRVCIITL